MANLRHLFIAIFLVVCLVLAQTPDPNDGPSPTIADPVVTVADPVPTVNPRDTEQDGGDEVVPTDSGSGSDESGSDESGSGETGSDGGSEDTGSGSQPDNTAPAETAPAETAPAETAPAETEPADPKETESSDPSETDDGGDAPTETDAASEPSETKGLLPPSPTDAEEPASTDVEEPASTDAEEPSPTSNDEPSETESEGPSNTDSEESSPADSDVPTETGDEDDSPTATNDSSKATATDDSDDAKSTDSSDDDDDSKTDSDSPTKTGDDGPTATNDEDASETTDSSNDDDDDDDDDTSTKSGDAGSGSETSSSSPSTKTDSEHEDTGIVAVGPRDGTESTKETPADVTTPEQHEAEAMANLPSTVISGSEAEEIVVMEAIMFDHFANNDPAPGDSGVIEIASNVSSCKVGVQKRDTWGNRAVNRMMRRDLRTDCKYVTSLEFDVNFNYIRSSADGERPNQLQDRIEKGMKLLNDAYGGLGLTFNYKNYQQYAPPNSGDNKDWSMVKQFSDKLQNFQTQTRSGDEMTLNVWLVNELQSADGKDINAFTSFPWDKKGSLDGIVLREDRINKDDVPTLIHEVGHWLGLRHTFREQVEQADEDCKAADTLIKSSITTGLKESMYQCKQTTCSGSTSKDILNFMSYSQCRGKIAKNGFTTDQKSSIFSRVLKYRRGFRDGECTPTYTASTVDRKLAKRSTMQDLIDGVCPNVAAGVQDLESQPTNTNQGAALGFNLVSVVVAVAASMFFMI